MVQEKGQAKRNEEVILKVVKEIVVKFIEMGKVTPVTFDETFRSVYRTVDEVANRGG